MSDRYITLRSFAVITSSLRMGWHLSVSSVVPVLVQRPCRKGPALPSHPRSLNNMLHAVFSRTLRIVTPWDTPSPSPAGIIRCGVAATMLLVFTLTAPAQTRPETPNETPRNNPATEPTSPSEPGSLLEPIVRDGSAGQIGTRSVRPASPTPGNNADEDQGPVDGLEGLTAEGLTRSPAGLDSSPIDQAYIDSLPEVSFAQTLDAFGVVRTWLDKGGVPALDGTPLPPAYIASVIIRDDAGIVGEHTTVATTERQAIEAVRIAAAKAIQRAVARLEGPPDALRRERLRANLARTRLSLEISTGAPVPVAEGVTQAELDGWIRPGIEGMLLRYEGASRARTPAAMLASGRSASQVAITLIAEVAGDPTAALKPYEELAAEGYALSFFRVRHAAQSTPDAPPLMLHRGGAVVPSVRTDELVSLADRMARHIRGRSWAGVERIGLRDGFDPVSGRFARGGGSPFAQAFAAEALLRYAKLRGADPTESAMARRAGEATLSALAVVEGDERAPWGDAISASACVSALAALDRASIEKSDELRGLRERCLPVVDRAYNANRGFDPMIPAAGRGVVCRALVALASFEPWNRERHIARADEAIRAVYRETPGSDLLGQMPDLAWADLELADRTGLVPSSADALRALRTQVLDFQLGGEDLAEIDRDLAGGFVLEGGASPLPTWQSVRPTALLAAMLGEPSLTRGTMASGEIVPQLLELSESLRFLAQLTADERLSHMYSDPARAIGGVRSSLWDQTMPLTASALGLLTLADTLDALDAIGSRAGDAAGRP